MKVFLTTSEKEKKHNGQKIIKLHSIPQEETNKFSGDFEYCNLAGTMYIALLENGYQLPVFEEEIIEVA